MSELTYTVEQLKADQNLKIAGLTPSECFYLEGTPKKLVNFFNLDYEVNYKYKNTITIPAPYETNSVIPLNLVCEFIDKNYYKLSAPVRVGHYFYYEVFANDGAENKEPKQD